MGDGNHKDDNKEEDPKESGEEDPVNGQTGKEYTPKTKKGKEMARMFISFCRLSKSSANTIVVYFGVSTMDKLTDFGKLGCKFRWNSAGIPAEPGINRFFTVT